MDITKVDSNFKVETTIEKEDIKFYSPEESPFKIYGVFKENGKYRRMPEAVAKTVSERVYILHSKTAGGRVRFVTDSSYVAISAKVGEFYRTSHGVFTNTAGFDMYADGRFIKSFIPPFEMEDGYESVLEIGGERKLREITISFPNYAEVTELYIGLQEDACLKEASPYRNEKPIVYYGSSITQGGCASRPGMSYEAIIARELNYDFVNLGFSGNAKAEDEIADYIAGLDMSLFVYDYDHNAPSVEHLRNTHERMFKKIREKQPDLPIIIMPRPKYYLNEEEIVKRDIIKATYDNAVSSGDKNVYFIDGKELMALCKDNGTVDNTHPTDLGFTSIAKALSQVIINIDNKKLRRGIGTMSDITKVDTNFAVNTSIKKEDIKFHSIEEKPFKIYGIFKENGKYRRMPEAVAKTVSERVYILHSKTAGGRVRFATDSSYVAIKASMENFQLTSHGTFTGSAGFDMYADGCFIKSFIPPIEMDDGYESVLEIGGERKMREITINFPSFAEVIELHIGLQEDACLKEASPYRNEKPIVYYGSSITHGGCASRPGMSYEAIIEREMNYDFINLGFSGNAKAEDEIADYIAGLDMSLFVYDYDHNAPSVEHLRNTHERMFKKVRAKKPDLPIIIMPRPKYYLNEEEIVKRDIIKATYDNAVSAGDKNVYFIDGKELMALCKDNGTVDNTHPTDFGFNSMARAVMKVIEEINI